MKLTESEQKVLDCLNSIEWVCDDPGNHHDPYLRCPSCGRRAHYDTGLAPTYDELEGGDVGEDLSDEHDAAAFAMQVTEPHLREHAKIWVHDSGCRLDEILRELLAKAAA